MLHACVNGIRAFTAFVVLAPLDGALTDQPDLVLLLLPRLASSPNQPTTQQGKPENIKAAQEALLKRAKANSDAQLGQYDPANESAEAGERTYEKGYKVCLWLCGRICV